MLTHRNETPYFCNSFVLPAIASRNRRRHPGKFWCWSSFVSLRLCLQLADLLAYSHGRQMPADCKRDCVPPRIVVATRPLWSIAGRDQSNNQHAPRARTNCSCGSRYRRRGHRRQFRNGLRRNRARYPRDVWNRLQSRGINKRCGTSVRVGVAIDSTFKSSGVELSVST